MKSHKNLREGENDVVNSNTKYTIINIWRFENGALKEQDIGFVAQSFIYVCAEIVN